MFANLTFVSLLIRRFANISIITSYSATGVLPIAASELAFNVKNYLVTILHLEIHILFNI